jgi:hypothetical protein
LFDCFVLLLLLPLSLQLLAEAWVKAHHPINAALREAGMEWRHGMARQAHV